MTAPEQVEKAIAALRNNDFAGARDCIAAYGRSHGLELSHYLIRGLAELSLADWPAAAATFTEATGRFPEQAQLWLNLGTAQENGGDFTGAVASYERCLKLDPTQAAACGNLSNAYRQLARFAEAEKTARRALELGASKVLALNSLGLALNGQNKFAEAEAAFAEVLKLEPENALALSNLGNLMMDQLDLSRAIGVFERARAASGDDPLIRHFESMALLQNGDWQRGWAMYEARLELPKTLRVRPPCPLWKGENLAGKKLMIVAEQGFGDVIQFCRYGNLLAQTGARLFWVVPKSLKKLMEMNLPGHVSGENEPLPEADYFLPIMSLPRALGKLWPEDAPTTPYLRAPAEPKLPLNGTGGKIGPKIGVVWTASPTNLRDYEKSMPLAALAPLWKIPDAQFCAPFINPRMDEIAGTPVARCDHLIKDFADTAALIGQLDLLISVDTAAAHLAGAMGVKTFMMLAYCPDWRWGTKGDTSMWYPSTRLFRQPQPGNWQAVIEEIAKALS